MDTIITGDESWVLHYDSETKKIKHTVGGAERRESQKSVYVEVDTKEFADYFFLFYRCDLSQIWRWMWLDGHYYHWGRTLDISIWPQDKKIKLAGGRERIPKKCACRSWKLGVCWMFSSIIPVWRFYNRYHFGVWRPGCTNCGHKWHKMNRSCSRTKFRLTHRSKYMRVFGEIQHTNALLPTLQSISDSMWLSPVPSIKVLSKKEPLWQSWQCLKFHNGDFVKPL